MIESTVWGVVHPRSAAAPGPDPFAGLAGQLVALLGAECASSLPRSRAASSNGTVRSAACAPPRGRPRTTARRVRPPPRPTPCHVQRRRWGLPAGARRPARPGWSASAPPSPAGSAELTLSVNRAAACRPRQPSDGLPAVSAEAMIRPPNRLMSVSNSRRWRPCVPGSRSFQNIRAPRFAGMTVAARAAEATRGTRRGEQRTADDLNGSSHFRERLGISPERFEPTGSGSFCNP